MSRLIWVYEQIQVLCYDFYHPGWQSSSSKYARSTKFIPQIHDFVFIRGHSRRLADQSFTGSGFRRNQ
ncbi:MAG: hypothetical protein ACM3PY_19440 [Omnitrophica WOR_2 bacterium]